MNKIYYLIALPLLLLQGCATINDSKTMLITPEKGQSDVVVESITTAHCKDIIGVISCSIDIDLHQARREGEQVTTPPIAVAPQPIAVAQPPAATPTEKSNGNALARLKALDELNKNGMLSKEEYKQKRQEILKDL